VINSFSSIIYFVEIQSCFVIAEDSPRGILQVFQEMSFAFDHGVTIRLPAGELPKILAWGKS
jgi:hypothetical protein